MKTLTIELPAAKAHKYSIFTAPDLRKNIAEILAKEPIGKKYAIISDDKVAKLYANHLKNDLAKHQISAEIYTFKNGESQKTLETVETILTAMTKDGFDRHDAVIAYGGGVVGDLGGFIASIYMRGIPVIQIPTTLLAMADSSIGGKTGGNLASGKNLFGTFHQPHAIFLDPEHLKTLSLSHIRNGLAEIIKVAVIADREFFEFLETNSEKLLTLDPEAISHSIAKSAEIKARIVAGDEKEHCQRMLLNYGHTYGHAIEAQSEYKLLHGFAVSIGMVLANKIAVAQGLLSNEDSDRIKSLLKKVELPLVTVQKPRPEELFQDKKKAGNTLKFILPTTIGQAKIVEIPLNELGT